MFGLAVLSVIVAASFLAPLPFDPYRPDAGQILQAPNANHWFGTDLSGFDIFSRVLAAGRLDLPLALAGTLASLVVGVPLGLLASGKGQSGERVMRVLDAFQAFPLLILAIAIVALTGDRLGNIVLAIALVNVPRFMRLVRSEALSLRESRFVEAAVVMGASRSRVLFRHLLPNVVGVSLAQFSLAAAHAIIVIAAMSFLGVGISPPTASWGAMIQQGARGMASGNWWISTFPGVAVFVSVAALNLMAYRLEMLMGRGDI